MSNPHNNLDQAHRQQAAGDAVEDIDLELQQTKNEPIGDALQVDKQPGITRLYFQNVNGFNLGPFESYYAALEHLQNMEVDHAMFCEHKLDTTKPYVTTKLYEIARKRFGSGAFKIQTASSSIPFATSYKPGGTMSLTVGALSSRVVSQGKDYMGRWVYTKFRGVGHRIITIITTYQVCNTPVETAGDLTAISQQHAMLLQAGAINPKNVRAHHAKDLLEFVTLCQTEGDLVIVAGDFNEEIGLVNTGLTHLCSQRHLQDIILAKHQRTDYTTYSRGTKILDYILIDPALEEAVVACGAEPFLIRIMGDHRGLYVDFNTALLLGTEMPPLARPSLRELHSKKAHQLCDYWEAVDHQLTQHHWYEGIEQLQLAYDSNQQDHQLAERLDHRRIRAASYGSTQVKPYPKPPYSPKIARLRNIDSLLNLIIRNSTSKVSLQDQIHQAQMSLQELCIDIPSTVQACKDLRKTNRQELRATIQEEIATAPSRKQHLEELIHQREGEGKTDAAKAIRRMMAAEELHRIFLKCAKARGKIIDSGISHLLVPEDPDTPADNNCTDWVSISDPGEITQRLIDRIQFHFGQAQGSTWTSGPLDTSANFQAADAMAEEILNGNFVPDGPVSPQAQRFLHFLVYDDPMHREAIPWEVTEAEFQGKVKAWNERTSSSPKTGIHLGHAKAYFAVLDLDPDDPRLQRVNEIREKVLRGHLLLLNYAIKFGFVYERWKFITNTLLEKDPGVPKLHRLRTIHLYEWDWSLLLGVKWRKLLHYCYDKGLIQPSSHGGVQGRSAPDAIFMKELEYEVTRLTRKPLVIFDNDAKACFDRIPCYLGNLVGRKHGLPVKIAVVQGKTMEEAHYHVKTKLGISDDYASHTVAKPFYGPGQGATYAPGMAILLIGTGAKQFSTFAHGATYESPDRQATLKVYVLTFIDDSNTRFNDFVSDPPPPIEDLLQAASQDAQLWHDIIVAINQELELSKCSYHAIYYEFEPSGKPVLACNDEPPGNLQINDVNGNPVSINYVPNSKPIKYLGLLQSPDNQRDHLVTLKKKAKNFAKVINCTNFSPKEAKIFYQAIYKPSMSYSLPLCHFTIKQLDTVQSQAHRAIVAKCGYNRNTAKAILYGPHHLGGDAFSHLIDVQGLGQLQMFLKFWRHPEEDQGKLLRIVMAWAQYCAGISRPILEDTTTNLPHLETKWITSLRSYLQEIEGTLELSDPQIPPLQRLGDVYLMDHALTMLTSPSEIRRFNYCRLYLGGPTTLADVTNANGTHIDASIYNGDRLQRSEIPCRTWHLVHQRKPDPASWAVWRKVLRSFTTTPKGTTLKLQQPLGHWTVLSLQQRRTWPFLLDRDRNILYARQADGTFTMHKRLRILYDCDPDGEAIDQPG